MSEFQQAVDQFRRAVSRAIATCQSIPIEAWNGTPDQPISFGEILEHMAIANGLTGRRLQAIARIAEDDNFASALEDDEIPHVFWRGAEPPNLAVPTGTWTDRDEAIERFRSSMSELIDLASTECGDMRKKGEIHPIFGPLDGVQWALFAAAHTERHRSEMIGLLGQR